MRMSIRDRIRMFPQSQLAEIIRWSHDYRRMMKRRESWTTRQERFASESAQLAERYQQSNRPRLSVEQYREQAGLLPIGIALRLESSPLPMAEHAADEKERQRIKAYGQELRRAFWLLIGQRKRAIARKRAKELRDAIRRLKKTGDLPKDFDAPTPLPAVGHHAWKLGNDWESLPEGLQDALCAYVAERNERGQSAPRRETILNIAAQSLIVERAFPDATWTAIVTRAASLCRKMHAGRSFREDGTTQFTLQESLYHRLTQRQKREQMQSDAIRASLEIAEYGLEGIALDESYRQWQIENLHTLEEELQQWAMDHIGSDVVSAYVAAGVKQTEIAERLKQSPATICRRVDEIRRSLFLAKRAAEVKQERNRHNWQSSGAGSAWKPTRDESLVPCHTGLTHILEQF